MNISVLGGHEGFSIWGLTLHTEKYHPYAFVLEDVFGILPPVRMYVCTTGRTECCRSFGMALTLQQKSGIGE
jgi:hypothetical protein